MWLQGKAREAWDELVPILETMGVLTLADAQALARYCRTMIRWQTAEDFLDHYGTSYPLKDGNGKVKCFAPFPQVAEAAKLAQILARLEQEFGLTPSARSRVQVTNIVTQTPHQREICQRYFGPRLVAGPPSPLDEEDL